MFRVNAATRSEYLAATGGPGSDLHRLDAFIRDHAPSLEAWFYDVGPDQPGMTFKMLGYGRFSYRPRQDRDELVEWPVIGVAAQKNYSSVYLSVTIDGRPVLDAYRAELNCTRSGRNNFSFTTFDQLDQAALGNLIEEVANIYSDDPDNPMRYKQG